MFPIRDDAPRSTTPFINYFLIVLNIGIFLFEWSLQLTGGPRARADFEMQFAFVPEHVAAWMKGYLPASVAFVPFLSSMFLHASLPHVLLNMWGLAIFGDNVEDRLGDFRGYGSVPGALSPGTRADVVGIFCLLAARMAGAGLLAHHQPLERRCICF